MTQKNEKMENSCLAEYLDNYAPIVEDSIYKNIPYAKNKSGELNKAIKYAVFSGGKRIRPILTLLGAELFDVDTERVLGVAAAMEFIHASSLIFDDLPSMDDATERRGKPALHKKFGEGVAILGAISLLNAAYGLMFQNQADNLENAVLAHAELVECIGALGMAGGQAIDLTLAQGAKEYKNPARLEKHKNLKTSALMRLSVCVGAILVGAKGNKLNALREFAELLGEAYQLRDDAQDIQEDSEIFKATAKTQAINDGLEIAKLNLEKIVEKAKNILKSNFDDSEARSCLLEISESLKEIG